MKKLKTAIENKENILSKNEGNESLTPKIAMKVLKIMILFQFR